MLSSQTKLASLAAFELGVNKGTHNGESVLSFKRQNRTRGGQPHTVQWDLFLLLSCPFRLGLIYWTNGLQPFRRSQRSVEFLRTRIRTNELQEVSQRLSRKRRAAPGSKETFVNRTRRISCSVSQLHSNGSQMSSVKNKKHFHKTKSTGTPSPSKPKNSIHFQRATRP